MGVPDDRHAETPRQRRQVAEREHAVVVLDDQTAPCRLRQQLGRRLEAVERGGAAGRARAAVQHDHGLGPEPHGVQQARLPVQLGARPLGDPGRLRVQHRVLAGVGGQPQARTAGLLPEGGEIVEAGLDLAVELR